MELVGSVKQPYERRFFSHWDQLGVDFSDKY